MMKNPIEKLNKAFENRIRLGVMSALVVNEEMNFNDLKQLLEVTDGNLATHLGVLEAGGFIKVHKGFAGRRTLTTYAMTRTGEKAFRSHLEALESMIRNLE
jgi:DNA-binding MarR family transcriptional regulator